MGWSFLVPHFGNSTDRFSIDFYGPHVHFGTLSSCADVGKMAMRLSEGQIFKVLNKLVWVFETKTQLLTHIENRKLRDPK